MTNRQDRRYAAKRARQAVKRGKTPVERALFGAAVAYATDRAMDLDFTLEGFDAAWARLEPDLRDLLEGGYGEFRRDVFAEAAWGRMVATAASGEEREYDLEPILFPVTGTWADIRAFTNEAAHREALAASLRASGMFPEEAAIAILPAVLAPEAVDLTSVGPAATSQLTFDLAQMFHNTSSTQEEPLASIAIGKARLPLVETGADDDVLSCLLVGICLAPAENWDISEDEADARRMALAATRASWLDTYAADLPFRLDEPVFWHEAGSSLAWHEVAGDIEAELSRHGGDEPVTQIHACLDPEAGENILAARRGETYLGPFRASGPLVSTDIDGFAGLAEHFAGELVEHVRPQDVLRLIGAPSPARPAPARSV